MAGIDLYLWAERAPIPVPRSFYAAGALDGRLVVAGGTYWRNGRKFWCDRVDCFDPRSNRWESAAPMPQRWGEGTSATCDGALYVLGGGAEGSTVATVLSFRNGAWNELPRMILPAPRRLVSAVVADGTLYVLGGLAGAGFDSAVSTAWSAKPGEAWADRAPVPGPPRFNAAAAAVDGRIILAGGATPERGGLRNLDDILSYDPHKDTWSTAGRLPVACRGACGLEDGSRVLFIGGYAESFESQILSIEPRTGRVSVVGRLPHALCETLYLRVGDRIIGAGGEHAAYERAPWTLEAGA